MGKKQTKKTSWTGLENLIFDLSHTKEEDFLII